MPEPIHILLGTPLDDCAICRAHPDGVVTEAQLATCACPLCATGRRSDAAVIVLDGPAND